MDLFPGRKAGGGRVVFTRGVDDSRDAENALHMGQLLEKQGKPGEALRVCSMRHAVFFAYEHVAGFPCRLVCRLCGFPFPGRVSYHQFVVAKMIGRANEAHSVDAPIAPALQIVHPWRRATDAQR